MTKSDTTKSITAEEFNRRFDDGEAIGEFVDWSTARRPGLAAHPSSDLRPPSPTRGEGDAG